MVAGPISLAAQKLREMVADCAIFQSQGGHANAAEALEKIFLREVLNARDERPYAIISPLESFRMRAVSGGSQIWMRPSGGLAILMEIETPADYWEDRLAADFYACDYFGQVISELGQISGLDENLPLTLIEMIGFGENPKKEHQSAGRYYQSITIVEWEN